MKLIFDTDMGNDIDDALALAMVHALQSRGECELLAVTITKDQEEAAPYVDALNVFYRRGDIPVGIVKGGVTPEKGLYTGVTREKRDDAYVFPHNLQVGDPVRDAVDLLRETLAGQIDDAVTIVQVGFSTNLSRLLLSPPDRHSGLTGIDLVRKKVHMISIMAGAFAPIKGGVHLEFNVIKDIAAAQHVSRDWPTPIVWSGFEVGLAVLYPAVSIERDFRYRTRHPIPESYQAYIPVPHERPTWDLTSVLFAVRPDRGYFGVSPAGEVTVHDDGETTFVEKPGGLHTYLTLNPASVSRLQELFALLASEPPTGSAAVG